MVTGLLTVLYLPAWLQGARVPTEMVAMGFGLNALPASPPTSLHSDVEHRLVELAKLLNLCARKQRKR
ncbi:hypothetical protein E2C01_013651 [Portunus trituberculatus]|uniref:Uncharacterized protein n=1 Tax=Portunus trituberculatus TaxID=210409 RepID=A0A5B7DHV0_PORTR|nr:hypothetical protein [Portunus trituberculatus]